MSTSPYGTPWYWEEVEDGVYGDEGFWDDLESGVLAQEWDRRVADNALDDAKIKCWIRAYPQAA